MKETLSCNLFKQKSLKEGLWCVWSEGSGSVDSNRKILRKILEELEPSERLALSTKISACIATILDPPIKINENTEGLTDVLLIIEYSLFNFDSGSVEMIRLKIDSFVRSSSVDPQLVYSIYPIAHNLDSIKLDE